MPLPTPLPTPRSRLAASLALLLAILVAATGLADRALTLLPQTPAEAGERLLQENLTRAAALFATARALNAAISVAQSAEVTAGVGVQGTVSPGQALDPINDLVERFSAVMLTATVALGGTVLLVQAGDLWGLSVLLPLGLGLVLLALWIPGTAGHGLRRAGLILLVAAGLAKVGLPAAVMLTEGMAERLLDPRIATATANLEAIEVPAMPTGAGDDPGWLERLRGMSDITGQVSRAFAAAGGLADEIIDLTVAWTLKIVVLPLGTLWLLARLLELLIAGLVPRRE
ncbi:MAG TPA: hypothetical protein VED40_00205 [Azospirillaceae bacterium]|nr:hypothetical protein [Azospirillaceae bacterium]